MGEAVEHQADRGQGDHCLGDLGQRLVILRQSPPSAEPAERPFDHPAARLHDEACAACWAADDDQRQAEHEAGEQGGEPRRWLVERSLGWFGRWRRLSKDYEALPEVSEAMVTLAAIRLMLHRLSHPNRRRLTAS